MALSIFGDEEVKPQIKDVKEKLGTTFETWNLIQEYVKEELPPAFEEWSFTGKKYGWNCHMVSKKRRIIYMIPCDGYFKDALVFGKKSYRKSNVK